MLHCPQTRETRLLTEAARRATTAVLSRSASRSSNPSHWSGERFSWFRRGLIHRLVAQNLNTFIRMAAGVDDETGRHHLRSGDISKWFEEVLKNKELVDRVRSIEGDEDSTQEAKEQIIDAIRAKYTQPA